MTGKAMNRIFKTLSRSAVACAFASVIFSSCSLEAPFADGGEGDLTITTEIRSDVVLTRAISNEDMTSLRENCVVYIENTKGLIRKYKGIDNIPEQIKLRVGDYVAEAWSGDSVSASFDKKFYRGYQKFEVSQGQNALTLKCNIANVIVSVDPASLDVNLSDMKVTFKHSKGSLEFNKNSVEAGQKGYFMMPNADKDVAYIIEGTQENGTPYSKTGVIKNVQRAHEYSMKISQDAANVTEGGALIKIEIADIPVIEEEVEVFPGPAVRGVEFDLSQQVVNTEKSFNDVGVYIRGYYGLSSVIVNFSDNFIGYTNAVNILNSTSVAELAAKGVKVERRVSKDASVIEGNQDVTVDELYVTFSKAMLDALAPSSKEYTVTFEATDERHLTGSGSLRIANSNDAVEHLDPVSSNPVPGESENVMAILARRATLTGAINDIENANNFGIKYREQGQSAWIEAYPSSANAANARRVLRSKLHAGAVSRAASATYEVIITDLKPGTTYEYCAFCDGFDSSLVRSFTTESEYKIENASFENWSSYTATTLLGTKDVIFAGLGNNPTYWDSGNEGASTANITLTNKSTDMVHSGTYSARLESKSAMGMIAAGNIFIGDYVKTDGTNGVLALGRPYNGSHPTKVRVYANYRPGKSVKVKSGNESYVDVVADGTDHGQVYIALTDQVIDIRTNPSNRKLFTPDDEHVLAYNQITWTEAFGPDGQLQLLEIPFIYFERAKTKRPTHLVIVASASKFGDFFSGSAGSVMYFDDFELVYE